MKRALLALISVTSCAALAAAQTAPSGTAPTSDAHPAAGADSGKPVAMNNNAAAQAGMMMARTGGSLLKASLAAPPDPGQAKLSQVSFIAVPEKEAKTLKKHDLVTIVIREESEQTTKGTNDFKKNVELQAEIAQMIKLKLGKGSIYGLTTPTAAPGVDLTSARTFHGEGDVERTDSMIARITAEILDVKPNGTLVLQARKHIKTDQEVQQFILTGICRAEDITPDNSILSTQLYDLSLEKNSNGDVHAATERGNLPKLLDFLNLF